MRHDIKLAAKMTHTLDARNNLWTEPSENGLEGGEAAQVSHDDDDDDDDGNSLFLGTENYEREKFKHVRSDTVQK